VAGWATLVALSAVELGFLASQPCIALGSFICIMPTAGTLLQQGAGGVGAPYWQRLQRAWVF